MKIRFPIILSLVVLLMASCEKNPEISIDLIGYPAKDVQQSTEISAKSQGIPTVHTGQTVNLTVAAYETSVKNPEWFLIPAEGSASVLKNSETLIPSFMPDKAGNYRVHLSAQSEDGQELKADYWITVADFVGSGYPVNTGDEAQCINCHSEYVTSWSTSGHGTIFKRGISGEIPDYDKTCFECHAVGYQNDYKTSVWIEEKDNIPEILESAGPGQFENLVKNHSNIANLTGIQCEMCHGPGSLHKGEIDKNQISSKLNSEVCGYCHEFTSKTSVYSQFRSSPHMRSMDTPDEHERMNKEGCAHCHTTQGFWNEILEKNESSAPYANAVGFTCVTCHDPHLGEESEFQLRRGSVANACTGCHDILVQNDTEDFSSCPQGSIQRGEGGVEFLGYSYSTGGHSAIGKNCAGCHMAKNPDTATTEKTGGHTFNVITKGSKPYYFNSSGCNECHDNMDMEYVRTSQNKYRKLLKELGDLLPARTDEPDKPLLPEDPALSDIQSKASFNYYTVLMDGTYGVHNPVYIKQLLESSIEALKR